VVDDNRIILKTTSTKLQAAGYEVLTAEDGGSAIRQVRQLKPHLILLDLNFPPDVGNGGGIPWDGFLILSWLRRSNEIDKVPVIVITGGDLNKYKDRWVEAGVKDIFLKPIDHDALLAAIRWNLDEAGEQDITPNPKDQPAQPAAEAPAEPPPVVETEVRRKVLFVDDTNDWRYLGASHLGERGYEVATAEDAISAMLQASQFKPNLVVLDLNLNGQSAAGLLKGLSQLNTELRILIYTGMDLSEAEVSELLKQGAWNCLRKGSLEELVSAVEETFTGPQGSVPFGAPAPAKEGTAKASPASAGMPDTAIQSTDPALDSADALQSLDDLRTMTTEELLGAVRKARNAAPEQTQAAPEPVVIPDEVIESAAKSVLIVEDDAAFADTLRSSLESHSFRSTSVTTGAEAVSLITAADVDLILFDLTLPDFPVRKFYDAVNAVKPHLCTRIIYMTSDDSHPGDDGFVRRLKGISLWKPFPIEWLLEAVQTIRAGTPQDRVPAQ
jgi:DNA-binding response OmpR family regulator